MILAPSAGVAPVLPSLAIVSAQERWGRRCQLCHATAEAVVDAPGGEVEILRPVVVGEELGIKGDGIVDIAVGHHRCIVPAQDVAPWTYGRLALADADDAGLAIVVAEGAVRLLHDIGRPHHLRRGPVHDHVLPVDEVVAGPHLCRSVAVACAVGGGIDIIDVAKAADGGVGKIAWQDGVDVARGVPRLSLDGRGCVLPALSLCRRCQRSQQYDGQ